MNMIVAFCKNRGIGYKNKLPWNIPSELQYFKKKTTNGYNNVVVMGRTTWDSLPNKPLKNRQNIILSKSLNNNELKKYENTYCISDFKLLDNEINNLISDHKIWLIGGKSIFDYYIKDPKLDKIYVTHINDSFSYDVQFPQIPKQFDIMNNSKLFYHNTINYSHVIYKNFRV
jgi:dihydrofolate reductase